MSEQKPDCFDCCHALLGYCYKAKMECEDVKVCPMEGDE